MVARIRRTVLRILGVIALLFVALGAAAATLFPRNGPPRVAVSEEVVGILAGHSYVWIIRPSGGAGAALVDTSDYDHTSELLEKLEAEHLAADDVRTVLLTHAHFDHIGGCGAFPKATFYVGAADVPLLRGTAAPKGFIPRIGSRFMTTHPPPENVHELHGGESIDLGGGAAATVIATPGHTEGSMTYLYKDVLFTGDSLLVTKDGVKLITRLFCDDIDENRRSLSALLPFRFTTIADGHCGAAGDAHRKLEAFLKQ